MGQCFTDARLRSTCFGQCRHVIGHEVSRSSTFLIVDSRLHSQILSISLLRGFETDRPVRWKWPSGWVVQRYTQGCWMVTTVDGWRSRSYVHPHLSNAGLGLVRKGMGEGSARMGSESKSSMSARRQRPTPLTGWSWILLPVARRGHLHTHATSCSRPAQEGASSASRPRLQVTSSHARRKACTQASCDQAQVSQRSEQCSRRAVPDRSRDNHQAHAAACRASLVDPRPRFCSAAAFREITVEQDLSPPSPPAPRRRLGRPSGGRSSAGVLRRIRWCNSSRDQARSKIPPCNHVAMYLP